MAYPAFCMRYGDLTYADLLRLDIRDRRLGRHPVRPVPVPRAVAERVSRDPHGLADDELLPFRRRFDPQAVTIAFRTSWWRGSGGREAKSISGGRRHRS